MLTASTHGGIIPGDVIKLDFSNAGDGDGGSLADWNQTTNAVAPIPAGSVIRHGDGAVVSDLAISFSGGGGGFNNDPASGNWPGTGADPYYILAADDIYYGPGPVTATFSGLDPSLLYDVRIHSLIGNNAGAVETFTVTDDAATRTSVTTRGSRWAAATLEDGGGVFSGLATDGSGAIAVTVQNTSGGGGYYPLNAIVLEATGVKPVSIPVPNGSFELLYKPGTAIPGLVSPGGWTQGVGPACPIDSGEYRFDDATTGRVADIPGWVGYDRDGWIALGGTYGWDQTTGNLQGSVARQIATTDGVQYYLSNGGSWGNAAGGLIVSDAPLGDGAHGIYTLLMDAQGAAAPVALELLGDGVVLTPTSLVDPDLSDGQWHEFSRTYDSATVAGLIGSELTIVLGIDRGATGTQTRFDNVRLEFQPSAFVIPEPASLSLLGLGLLALRRRRK
jgi:hypothetical protein